MISSQRAYQYFQSDILTQFDFLLVAYSDVAVYDRRATFWKKSGFTAG